jgi:hypothetical protein
LEDTSDSDDKGREREERARSRSVIRARRALWDLNKKCCSLADRGRECGKSSSVPEELKPEYLRSEVGVKSGVNNPVMDWRSTECEFLYEILLRLFGSCSSKDKGEGLSQWLLGDERQARDGVGEGVCMGFMAFVIAESSLLFMDRVDLTEGTGVDFKEEPVLGGVGRPWNLLARLSGVKDRGRRLNLAGRGRTGMGLISVTTKGADGTRSAPC